MTRSQIREKYGISMLESPSVANKELSEKEAAEYEDCVSLHLRMFDDSMKLTRISKNSVPDANITEPQSLTNAIP